MEGLPKLPGLDFANRLKQNHTVSHCFTYKNGYRIPRKPAIGIGGEPLKEDSIEFVAQNDAVLYDPVLTYGRVKHPPVEPFRPRYVVYDRIVLTFKGFFKQAVPESADECYRVRHVKVMYFMEDDSITVIEPTVRNCGYPQGRLVRRGKIAKNLNMDYYSWKDLNIGIDIELNGIVYHLTDCDEFTREFMGAQGIELNESESQPLDPYTSTKLIKNMIVTHKSPSDDDKLRRYLEFSGKVLTFNAVLDETDRPAGEAMTYKVYYFLEDDTIAVRELKENQEGRDRFPMLLKRTKLPRNWKQKPPGFPSVYLETTEAEINEYYQPKNLQVGDTLFVFGRRLLLLDCDKFTRKYYKDVLQITQPNPLGIKFPEITHAKRPIPEYLGLGTPEDSLQACFGLTPKPPKKDVIRYLTNSNMYLRYGASLDNTHPEDSIRKFIISISLADGQIKINEPPIRNSGIKGGLFLSSRLVKRAKTNPDMPEYYEPKDFIIGAVIPILSHRFRIESADLYVYRYMQQHPEMFSKDAIDGVRNYLLRNSHLSQDIKCAIKQDCLSGQHPDDEVEEKPHLSELEECFRNITASRDASPPDQTVKDMGIHDCGGQAVKANTMEDDADIGADQNQAISKYLTSPWSEGKCKKTVTFEEDRGVGDCLECPA